jgi:hypothetical protein
MAFDLSNSYATHGYVGGVKEVMTNLGLQKKHSIIKVNL